MFSNEALDRISSLQPQHFFDLGHRAFFKVFKTLIGAGKLASHATIRQHLDMSDEDFERYMKRFVAEATTPFNISEYATTIRDCAIRRQVCDLADAAKAKAVTRDVDLDPYQQIAELEAGIAELRSGFGTDRKRLLQSSAEFVRDFVPPDYLVNGIIQRRYIYSVTGRTGSGKTAIALLIAASVAPGNAIGNKPVHKGRVIYLAGENPDDVRARWIAMAQQMDFDIHAIDVHFIPGIFSISEMKHRIAEEVERLGGASLIIIDTTAAYFDGDDENNNVQAGQYARMQRSLVELPGGPAVMALCHPVKNANDDNMLPRGGGAYLNEVDGNLTAKINNGIVELHWQGKFRGPDFAPLSFQLRTVTHERLKDSNGNLLPTIVASHITEAREKEISTKARADEDRLLEILADHQGASHAELAKLGGWMMGSGDPYKVMVRRMLTRLKKDGLVEDGRDGPRLTDAGTKHLKQGH